MKYFAVDEYGNEKPVTEKEALRHFRDLIRSSCPDLPSGAETDLHIDMLGIAALRQLSEGCELDIERLLIETALDFLTKYGDRPGIKIPSLLRPKILVHPKRRLKRKRKE